MSFIDWKGTYDTPTASDKRGKHLGGLGYEYVEGRNTLAWNCMPGIYLDNNYLKEIMIKMNELKIKRAKELIKESEEAQEE